MMKEQAGMRCSGLVDPAGIVSCCTECLDCLVEGRMQLRPACCQNLCLAANDLSSLHNPPKSSLSLCRP